MRVLVIEDNDCIREEICEFLVRQRHEVVACGSLAEGRAAAFEADGSGLESIICDVNLPDGSGADFCAKAALSLPNRRWILMSGDHNPEHSAKLEGVGADVVIVDKPVRMKELVNLLAATAG